MYVYCLFCETDKCEYIYRAAGPLFGCTALYPKQVQHTWSRGEMRDLERSLLPGYVFLYFEEDYPEVWRFRKLHGVLRLIRGKGAPLFLQGRDEEFAMMLLRKGGRIGQTPVWEEGQRIRICEGAFAGVEAKVLKVDRRATRMQVEIPFAGRPVKTWLEYEIIKNEEPEGGNLFPLPEKEVPNGRESHGKETGAAGGSQTGPGPEPAPGGDGD